MIVILFLYKITVFSSKKKSNWQQNAILHYKTAKTLVLMPKFNIFHFENLGK